MKRLLLGLVCTLIAATALADTDASTDRVLLRSDKSVAELREYVDAVDRRLQKGRYDAIPERDRRWIIEQIGALREALPDADAAAPPSGDLLLLASDFETGMIRIEEGGIVCRRERKTGTRMVTLTCASRERLREEREASQSSLRELKRPQSLPSGG
ncbi:MAG: hypothetical protein U1F26_13710 [Lysobacterales bacterium]